MSFYLYDEHFKHFLNLFQNHKKPKYNNNNNFLYIKKIGLEKKKITGTLAKLYDPQMI